MARRKWKRIAALALAAVITLEGAQTGQMPQVSAAQEESGSVQMPAAGETFSVERLTSNYTKISANYTAPPQCVLIIFFLVPFGPIPSLQ